MYSECSTLTCFWLVGELSRCTQTAFGVKLRLQRPKLASQEHAFSLLGPCSRHYICTCRVDSAMAYHTPLVYSATTSVGYVECRR